MKCTLSKKSANKHAAGPMPKGAVVTEFDLQDNGDNTLTLLGKSAAGNSADISAVATISPPSSSDNTAIITVDNPGGMVTGIHAVGPLGSANITITATWNDGSIGPFTVTVPGTVKIGPVSGVVVDLGTPSVH